MSNFRRFFNKRTATLLTTITLGIGVGAGCNYYNPEINYNKIMKIKANLANIKSNLNLPTKSFKQKLFQQQFTKEIEQIYDNKNPEINPNIHYVIVFSARASYLKRGVDQPVVKDPNDDFNRMQLGIEIARKVTCLRLNKQDVTDEEIILYGPTIVYNGRPMHNVDFKYALKNNLVNYPTQKFLILELPKDNLNTKGQLETIKNNIDLNKSEVALVSSAYHFPRIARMLTGWSNQKEIYFYLHDREFKAPGVMQELQSEMNKIPEYVRKGDLQQNIDPRIIFGEMTTRSKT